MMINITNVCQLHVCFQLLLLESFNSLLLFKEDALNRAQCGAPVNLKAATGVSGGVVCVYNKGMMWMYDDDGDDMIHGVYNQLGYNVNQFMMKYLLIIF